MQCKGKLRIVAKVDNPGAVAAMLRHLGLDKRPKPRPNDGGERVRSPTGTRIRLRRLSDSLTCFPSLQEKGTGATAAPIRRFTEPSLFLWRSNDSVEKTSAQGRKKARDEKPHESRLCAPPLFRCGHRRTGHGVAGSVRGCARRGAIGTTGHRAPQKPRGELPTFGTQIPLNLAGSRSRKPSPRPKARNPSRE